MNVAICDDHLLFGEALGAVLTSRGANVLGVVTTPAQAVSLVRALPIDVVVMDFSFPDDNGVDGARRVLDARPAVRVVLLTASDEPDVLTRALAAGVSGFALKMQEIDDVVRVIESVAAGDVVMGAALFRRMVASGRRPEQEQGWLGRFLTAREREVLERLVRGQSTRVIAAEMGVAYSTARTHIQSVLSKLGVHSRLEAAAFAVAHSLVDPPGRQVS